MNFEKIYANFEAAKAANDFDTMSDIIARVIEYCNALIISGRENEVTAHAIQIAEHINALLYRIMKLLSDGNFSRAKSYMLALAKNNVDSFDKFFQMLYLLGRSLYATGDYPWAIKIFDRYDQARSAN